MECLSFSGESSEGNDAKHISAAKHVTITPLHTYNVTESVVLETLSSTSTHINISTGSIKAKSTINIVERQHQRFQTMRGVCKKRNKFPNLKPNLFKRIFVDDERKFMYCLIFKVASSSFRKMLANSSGLINVSKVANAPVNDESFFKRIGLKYLSSYKPRDIKHRIDNYLNLIIVRDPFKRLLSAFRDRFEHSRDKNHYLKNYGRKIVRLYRKKYVETPIILGEHNALSYHRRRFVSGAANVRFEEFLAYVADTGLRGQQLNFHWNKYEECRPCTVNYNYIAKLETYKEDMPFILNKISRRQVPIATAKYGPTSQDSKLQTDDAYRQYYSRVPSSVIAKLQRVYGFDCEAFGYSCKVEL